MDFFSKDFIWGYFTRNKLLLIAALVLFTVPFVLGASISFLITENHGVISSGLLSGEAYIPLESLLMDSLSVFAHNVPIDFAILLSGLLFSIVSLILFIINAYMIGMPFGEDFLFAFLAIVPHSIFEYSASIFALVGAFLFTSIEFDIIKSFWDKDRSVRSVISDSKIKFKDIILSSIIMVVLLAVAAIIEGNITPRIVFWFFTGNL